LWFTERQQVVTTKEAARVPAATGKPLTISVEETARQLGIGRTLAYELARRGELPGAIRLGGRYVVSRRALERVIDGERKEPNT
jgi:excisionase family DNA binding protein